MMVKGMRTKRTAARKDGRRATVLTLTAEDLTGLARLVAGGRVLLQVTHPVVARLKEALTRMGLPIPQGL